MNIKSQRVFTTLVVVCSFSFLITTVQFAHARAPEVGVQPQPQFRPRFTHQFRIDPDDQEDYMTGETPEGDQKYIKPQQNGDGYESDGSEFSDFEASEERWENSVTPEDGCFEILPYWTWVGTVKPVLNWGYRSDAGANPLCAVANGATAEFTIAGEKKVVTAHKDRDIWRADSPLDGCETRDLGAELIEYQITGMPAPARVVMPPCAKSKEVQFTFLADTQKAPWIAEVFSNILAKLPSQFVLHGGDHVQTGGNRGMWRQFFRAMRPMLGNQAIVSAIGNHDYRDSGKQARNYSEFFDVEPDKAFYVVEAGPVRLFVLNSNFYLKRIDIEEQVKWLESALAVPAQWKIVAFHHPPFSNGIGHLPLPFLSKEHLKIRTYLLPLFEQMGVDLVLNGHTHLFERARNNGIEFMTTGAAGGRMGPFGRRNSKVFFSAQKRTAFWLSADDRHLEVQVLGQSGEVVDTWVKAKSIFSRDVSLPFSIAPGR